MSLISKRKGQLLFAGILVALALALFFLWKPLEQDSPKQETPIKEKPLKTQVAPEPIEPHKRRVIGDTAKSSKSSPPIKPQNTPSPEWKSSLSESIQRQGGRDLKDLQITPIESLVWVHEGKALNVETAKVSFKDPGGREISFKAMVDSQSGKILQTWDQPVVDDFSHSQKSGIKLDPRYLGQ